MQFGISKTLKRSMLSLFALSLAVPFYLPAERTEAAGAATEAFNESTGALDVDYASYLSKHDVVYNSPIADPKGALPVGTGKVGGMVWDTTDGLTMQVSGVDASPEGVASQGLVNLYTNPGLNTGYTTYKQRLKLYDGLLETQYDANRKITIMGAPNSEVMGIHVEDSRVGIASVSLDLSLWDVSNFSGGELADVNTWRTVSTFNDSTVAGFSRGQTDANHFGYTMAATVEGADFTTQKVDGNKVRLNIKPTSSYTIWIATASRLNAPGYDSVAQAKTLLSDVKTTGYSTTLSHFKDWWHDFWGKSFVQYANGSGDADYMESFYYLSTYTIAAGAFGNYPFHFINGVFSAVNDSDSGKWSNAYWYWNQRDVYHSFLASNHADMVHTFNNLYSRNYDTLKAYTQTRYGIDGIWVPETMGWNASASGTIGSDYTKNIFSTAMEAAMNMYNEYKYMNDAGYLQDTVYPFMREAVKFYVGKLSRDTATGTYYMASSNVHEQYWNVKNAITDLAAIRVMFPVAIEISQDLNVDAGLRAQWQDVLDHLAPYPTDPSKPSQYYPYEYTGSPMQNRNDENSLEELVWPYSVTGIGAPDYDRAVDAFNNRIYPFGDNVWDPAPIQAARLGLGDAVYDGMKTMIRKYQNYPNGRTTNTNGEFEYMGVNLSATNEALLQSYNDKIRVFPATPTDPTFVGRFTLMASGGFQVSSEKEAGDIKYVGIKSLYGKQATVVNPWGTAAVQVRRLSDNQIVTTSSANEFSFPTATNGIYVVERTSTPLGSFAAAQLTGTANQGVKALGGTNAKLGTDASGGRVAKATFYADGSFEGTAVALDPGSYTKAQLNAAGIPDNWASSVKVPAGYTVAVYDDDNFGGTKWLFTTDTNFPSGTNPNANDKMTSVKIYLTDGSTKYEAENGTLSDAALAYNDAAASGGKAVKLKNAGDSLTLPGAVSASKLVFTYATENDPGKIGLYVNGTRTQTISFPTNGVFEGGYPTLIVPVSIPGGANVKFQIDGGDNEVHIDSIAFISMDFSGVGLDVAQNLITGTTADMEYSLDSTDGLDGTWTAAKATSTIVLFTGGKVYVRDSSDHSHFSLVGSVPAFAGQKYEAESGTASGTVGKSNDSKASGGKMVDHFSQTGDSISIANVNLGSRIVISYCTANNPGRLSLYINGTDSGNITFPTTNSWNGTYSTVTVTKAIPAGATIKLQLDSGDSGANIDYLIVQAQELGGVSLSQQSSQLTGTNVYQEFSVNSTDGSGGNWTTAKADKTQIILPAGNVYVREAANHDNVKLVAAIPGTKYEAESGTLVKADASNDSGASGGKAVTGLSTAGQSSMTFTSATAGSKLVIGYTTDNSNSKLSLYINGTKAKSVSFPSTHAWSGIFATVTVDVDIPANAQIMLRLDSGDSGSNIDYFIVQPLAPITGVSYDVAAGKMTGTTAAMEISLDSTNGTDGTWTAAGEGQTNVAFAAGNVYVRRAGAPDSKVLLGTIAPAAAAPGATADLSGGLAHVKLVGASEAMEVSIDGGATWSRVTAELAAGTATLAVPASANPDMRVRVAATAGALASQATGDLIGVIPHAAPVIQSASAGDAHVLVSWNAAEDAIGYKLYVSTTPDFVPNDADAVELDAAARSYDATGLANGTTYYFILKAVYADADSPASASADATPQAIVVVIPSAALTGSASVAAGQTFSLNLGIADVTQDVYAVSVTVSYAPDKVSFVSAEALPSDFVVDDRSEEPGVLKLQIAGSDRTHTVTGTAAIARLNFQAAALESNSANAIGLDEVALEDADENTLAISDRTGYEGSILASANAEALRAKLQEASTLRTSASVGSLWGQYSQSAVDSLGTAIEAAQAVADDADAVQSQLNEALAQLENAIQEFRDARVQTVSAADLRFVGGRYGITSSGGEWASVARYDANSDGLIDIVDLATIARQLVN